MTVQQVFLSPIMDLLKGFGQVTALKMLQHLFRSYGEIDGINLEENAVKMIGAYETSGPLTRIIEQLKKGREFSRAGGQMIAYVMMVSKGITLLAQTETFNDDIREWHQQSTDLKMWATFKLFFQGAHIEQR